MNTPDQRLIALGQKIINYRDDAGIKQDAFAKELGISRTTLSFIENGSQAPSFDVLVKLAQITNININELIDVKTKNIVVVDTNILLNRPEMLGVLLKDCDLVYIPIPVIEELNYQKDHGREKERRNASLCEDIISKKKSDKLVLVIEDRNCLALDDKGRNLVPSLRVGDKIINSTKAFYGVPHVIFARLLTVEFPALEGEAETIDIIFHKSGRADKPKYSITGIKIQ